MHLTGSARGSGGHSRLRRRRGTALHPAVAVAQARQPASADLVALRSEDAQDLGLSRVCLPLLLRASGKLWVLVDRRLSGREVPFSELLLEGPFAMRKCEGGFRRKE